MFASNTGDVLWTREPTDHLWATWHYRRGGKQEEGLGPETLKYRPELCITSTLHGSHLKESLTFMPYRVSFCGASQINSSLTYPK